MLNAESFLFFMALLLFAIILEPVANKLRIPFSIVLVVIGFTGSEFVTQVLDIDTGIRWHNFHTIIFYVILPILVFQAAIDIDVAALKKFILPIFTLAVPLMLISTALIAAGIYYGINHKGFPWIAALLTGALLSATDPAAVMALLRKTNVPEHVNMILEGESLFNDATAVVLFTILIAIASSGEYSGGWSTAIIQFAKVFFGGMLVGIIVGWLGLILIRTNVFLQHTALITIIVTYTAFLLAEEPFHLSGVMAVLSAGLMISVFYIEQSPQHKTKIINIWKVFSTAAEALVFILAGVTITLDMFTDQWQAMLIGVVTVILVRLVTVTSSFSLMNLLPGQLTVPFREQLILSWGGVRGTITLALALSLPLTLDYWYTIQSIAYGVVLFTLFVNTSTMGLLIKN